MLQSLLGHFLSKSKVTFNAIRENVVLPKYCEIPVQQVFYFLCNFGDPLFSITSKFQKILLSCLKKNSKFVNRVCFLKGGDEKSKNYLIQRKHINLRRRKYTKCED